MDTTPAKPTAKPTAVTITVINSPIIFRCFKRKDNTVFAAFKAKIGVDWATVRADESLLDELKARIGQARTTIAKNKFAVVGYGRIEGRTIVSLRRAFTAEEIFPAAEILSK